MNRRIGDSARRFENFTSTNSYRGGKPIKVAGKRRANGQDCNERKKKIQDRTEKKKEEKKRSRLFILRSANYSTRESRQKPVSRKNRSSHLDNK